MQLPHHYHQCPTIHCCSARSSTTDVMACEIPTLPWPSTYLDISTAFPAYRSVEKVTSRAASISLCCCSIFTVILSCASSPRTSLKILPFSSPPCPSPTTTSNILSAAFTGLRICFPAAALNLSNAWSTTVPRYASGIPFSLALIA